MNNMKAFARLHWRFFCGKTLYLYDLSMLLWKLFGFFFAAVSWAEMKILRESRKDWPPIRGLPTDPAPRTTLWTTLRTTLRTTPRTTLRNTPRTTLNNQPNYFYGEEKHKKPTCSHVHDHNWKQPPFSFHRLSRPSLFHFRPILHRPIASETVKRKWRLFSVMIVYVGAGRLFVIFFPVKLI